MLSIGLFSNKEVFIKERSNIDCILRILSPSFAQCQQDVLVQTVH